MADPHFPPTQTNYLKIRTQHHEIHISYLFTDKVCEKQNLQNLNPTIHNTYLTIRLVPAGNALARVQWVHKPIDLFDITCCTL